MRPLINATFWGKTLVVNWTKFVVQLFFYVSNNEEKKARALRGTAGPAAGGGRPWLHADGKWRVPERACLRRGRLGEGVQKGERPPAPVLARLGTDALRAAVSKQLDAASRVVGGRHVLFDRQDPPASPVEQMIHHCLSKAEDTTRSRPPFLPPFDQCVRAWVSPRVRQMHALALPLFEDQDINGGTCVY